MSSQLPVPAASNTFEHIKRLNPEGHEFWSARELARVLEYTDFRNFTAVITKAREACVNSGHKVANHFVDINEMVGIGSGVQRTIEDWALSRYSRSQTQSVPRALIIWLARAVKVERSTPRLHR